MQIPTELLDKWRSMRSTGDNKGIIPNFNKTQGVMISRAFRFGICSDDLFKKIREFYEKKEKDLYTSKPTTDAK